MNEPATVQDVERRLHAIRSALSTIDKTVSDAVGAESAAREAVQAATLAAALDPAKAGDEAKALATYRAASEASSSAQAKRDALNAAEVKLRVEWQDAVSRERHADQGVLRAHLEKRLPDLAATLIDCIAALRLLHEARGAQVGRVEDIVQAFARSRPGVNGEVVKAAAALKAQILSNGKA